MKFIVSGGERMPFIPLCNGGLIWRKEQVEKIDAVTINYLWGGIRIPL